MNVDSVVPICLYHSIANEHEIMNKAYITDS